MGTNTEGAAGGALFEEGGTPLVAAAPVTGTPPVDAAPAAVEIPSNWKDSLPQEIRDAPYMKNVTDLQTLAKNYANAQTMIGADKIPLPGKDATAEQWRGVYEKLGLPKTKEEYKPEFSKDVKVDPAFLEKFKEAAFTAGMLPNQAKQVAEWFDKVNQEAYVAQETAFKEEVAKGMSDLKKEWGEAYGQKLAAAKTLMSMVDPEVAKSIRESGQGNNPHLIKLLSEIAAKTLKEGEIKGVGASSGKFSPEEAKSQLKELQGNANSAYFNASDPGHAAAVKLVRELTAMAYPGKSASK